MRGHMDHVQALRGKRRGNIRMWRMEGFQRTCKRRPYATDQGVDNWFEMVCRSHSSKS